jgi:hypothetical protein
MLFLAFLCALCETIRMPKRRTIKTAQKKRPAPRLVTKAHRLERDEDEAASKAARRTIRQTEDKR